MNNDRPIEIWIRGPRESGKSTIAAILKEVFGSQGWEVQVDDED